MGDKTAFEEGQAQIIGIDNNKQIPGGSGMEEKQDIVYVRGAVIFNQMVGVLEVAGGFAGGLALVQLHCTVPGTDRRSWILL